MTLLQIVFLRYELLSPTRSSAFRRPTCIPDVTNGRSSYREGRANPERDTDKNPIRLYRRISVE